MITERDYYNIIDTAKDDGIAIGKAEGIREGEARGRVEGIREGEAKGRTEAQKDIARKMLEAGMDRETIMKITGVSEI